LDIWDICIYICTQQTDSKHQCYLLLTKGINIKNIIMKTLRSLSPETIETFELDGYENRQLSQNEIMYRLANHGMVYQNVNGTIVVLEMFGNGDIDTTDATNWTLFDLLDFLNY